MHRCTVQLRRARAQTRSSRGDCALDRRLEFGACSGQRGSAWALGLAFALPASGHGGVTLTVGRRLSYATLKAPRYARSKP